jgi:hypothetical protein
MSLVEFFRQQFASLPAAFEVRGSVLSWQPAPMWCPAALLLLLMHLEGGLTPGA